jgi:hypothetical protein
MYKLFNYHCYNNSTTKIQGSMMYIAGDLRLNIARQGREFSGIEITKSLLLPAKIKKRDQIYPHTGISKQVEIIHEVVMLKTLIIKERSSRGREKKVEKPHTCPADYLEYVFKLQYR